MDNLEEQANEIEALQCIFENEFTWLNEPSEFEVLLEPSQEINEGEECHVCIKLHVTFHEEYPSTSAPMIEIVPTKGLGARQVTAMQEEVVAVVIEENAGEPIIFMLCEQLKEWLANNNVPGEDGSMYADMMRKQRLKELEVSKNEAVAAAAAQNGTMTGEGRMAAEKKKSQIIEDPVTVETFADWKATFEQEMKDIVLNTGKVNQKAYEEATANIDPYYIYYFQSSNDAKMNGKELFLSKKAKNVKDVEGEGENEGEGEDVDLENEKESAGEESEEEWIDDEDDEDDEDYSGEDD